MATVETADQPGVYLVGTLVDSRPGKPWTGRDGTTRAPHEVTLLAGRSTFRVEYRSEADAAGALEDAAKGDTVALRVFTRINKGYLFYSGLNARGDEAAA